MNNLENFKKVLDDIGDLDSPVLRENEFSTEHFLKSLATDIIQGNVKSTDIIYLNKLCKKVDVVGKIRAFYLTDLTKMKGEQFITLKYKYILLAVLFYLSKENNNYKFLNSGLKLLDHEDIKKFFGNSDFWNEWTKYLLNESVKP